MPYSKDPRVDQAVAKLLASVEEVNPYTRRGTTIADVRDVIEYAYGKAAAKSVKITVH